MRAHEYLVAANSPDDEFAEGDLRSSPSEAGVRATMVAYMAACDQHDAKAVAALFHQDATWLSRRKHVDLHGRHAIYESYKRACARLTFCVHYLTNEEIVVTGNRAQGRWYYFEPATNRGELAVWTAGHYAHEFAYHDGQWVFMHFCIDGQLAAPYEGGWRKSTMLALS